MIVIVLCPAFFVYLVPQLEFASAFLGGDRSRWLSFWIAAAAFEWAALLLVLLTYSRRPGELAEVGLPRPGPGTLLITALVVGAAVWAALALPGMPEEKLARLPYGATMFLPPADTGSRIFFVFISAKA
jgi:hypothetical protein